jgi:Flp pilus assembly protein TadG
MRTFGSIGRQCRKFGTDARGNFAVIFAVALSAITMGAAYGLNLTQLYHVRSDLSHALDVAVTSTARDLTTGKIAEKDARGMVEAFLSANSGSGFAPAERITLDRLVVDRAANTVEASASVNVAVALPLFGSGNERRVTVASAALYSDKRIEVAMMLDITGSMAGRKIEDLKKATRNAVAAFLNGQDERNPRVRVSLVPYADAVNTGPLAHTVFVERVGGSDAPPALDDPRVAAARPADACATERKDASGRPDFSDASPYAAMVNRDDRLGFCPRAGLAPLTADKDALEDVIARFRAEGHTAGHIGIQWTRYMLSPKWNDVLPRDSRPAAYGGKKVAKYAILMTDGEFNTAFAGVGARENPRNQPAKSRSYAERLCQEMRDDGIEVFTIGFMLNQANAKRVMRNCASPDTSSIRHYYEVADGAALDAAYREIAANIERLAITR